MATSDDAEAVARLLHDFNAEFYTPTPGVDILAERLRSLLACDSTLAIVAGGPPVAVALVTFRPNVWYAGPVALLDELYVVPGLRNRGIGSAMVEHLLALCAQRGVGLVEINVDEGDVDASASTNVTGSSRPRKARPSAPSTTPRNSATTRQQRLSTPELLRPAVGITDAGLSSRSERLAACL